MRKDPFVLTEIIGFACRQVDMFSFISERCLRMHKYYSPITINHFCDSQDERLS